MQRHICLSILLFLLILSMSAHAQWTATLTANSNNAGVNNQTVTFGVDAVASAGFDVGVDTPAAPPPPPPVLLDTFFPISAGFITRLSTDIRAAADSITWTYNLRADQDGGTLSWDVSTVPANLSLTLTPQGEPGIDMQTQNSIPFPVNPIPGVLAVYTITATVSVMDIPPWDVNQDCVINIFDLVLVGQDFGKQPPENPRTDVNKDGKVDLFDLVAVAGHFGESCK